MNNNLGIRPRPKYVAAAFQIGTQFLEVVDLPIANHPYGLVFIGDGLVSSCNIYNAETAHPKRDLIFRIVTVIVRSSMADNFPHLNQQLFSGLRTLLPFKHSVYATHTLSESLLLHRHGGTTEHRTGYSGSG